MALCALLSSTICFNIRKTFDEKTIDDLDIFKKLGDIIKIKPSHSATSLMHSGVTPGARSTKEDNLVYQDHLFPQLMPRLMWLVRDSQIELKDKKGHEFTENQFLEHQLSMVVKSKSKSRKIWTTRDKLISLFPDRELVIMRHPLGEDIEADQNIDLESIDLDTMQEAQSFVTDAEHLRKKVLTETPIKQIWSRRVNGSTLAFLLREFIVALNKKGNVIHFSDTWEFFLESELQEVYDRMMRHVDKTIRNHMWDNQEHGTPEGDSEDEVHFEKMPIPRQDVIFLFD